MEEERHHEALKATTPLSDLALLSFNLEGESDGLHKLPPRPLKVQGHLRFFSRTLDLPFVLFRMLLEANRIQPNFRGYRGYHQPRDHQSDHQEGFPTAWLFCL